MGLSYKNDDMQVSRAISVSWLRGERSNHLPKRPYVKLTVHSHLNSTTNVNPFAVFIIPNFTANRFKTVKKPDFRVRFGDI